MPLAECSLSDDISKSRRACHLWVGWTDDLAIDLLRDDCRNAAYLVGREYLKQ